MSKKDIRARGGMPRKEPPSIEELKEAAFKFKGNKSVMAEYFGVCRNVMTRWCREHPEVGDWVRHQTQKKFDGYLETAHVVASGIPERDENGVVIGWKVPPDTATLRFLIEKYGASEGFGREVKAEVSIVGRGGVPIAKWLELNSTEASEEGEE